MVVREWDTGCTVSELMAMRLDLVDRRDDAVASLKSAPHQGGTKSPRCLFHRNNVRGACESSLKQIWDHYHRVRLLADRSKSVVFRFTRLCTGNPEGRSACSGPTAQSWRVRVSFEISDARVASRSG